MGKVHFVVVKNILKIAFFHPTRVQLVPSGPVRQINRESLVLIRAVRFNLWFQSDRVNLTMTGTRKNPCVDVLL